MNFNKQQFISVLFLLTILTSGCHRVRKNVPDSMLTGHTTISADEAIFPLVNAELDIFHSLYNFSSIECTYGSEYDAINLLLQEKTRLALATRPLNQKEIDFFKSQNINPQSIVFAYDGIAIAVHPENKLNALTTGQISKILSGEILDWKQIPNSGRSGRIVQVIDNESSGIIRSLVDMLKLDKKISGDFRFTGNNRNSIDSVAANPNAIGFLAYNWLSEKESPRVQTDLKKINLLAVSSASVADSTNSYIPTVSTLFDKEYPLMRKIYALYTDPSASLARGFLSHLTSDRGQKIVYRIGLKPENDFQRLIHINKEY